MDPITAAYISTSREYGLHSQIPECCVEAYLADQISGVEFIAVARDEQMGYKFPGPLKHDYVPCPSCYEKGLAGQAPAVLHTCDPQNPVCRYVKAQYSKALKAWRDSRPEKPRVLDLARLDAWVNYYRG